MDQPHQQHQQQDTKAVRADPALFLDQDCMSHVFSFVGGRIHHYKSPDQYKRLSGSKRPSKKPKSSLRRLPLPGPGPYWTPREAAALVQALASVSKAWNHVVNESVSSVVSVPLHWNANRSTSKRGLAWITHHRLPLGKVRLPPGHDAIRLLQECDTTRLRDLEVTLALNNNSNNNNNNGRPSDNLQATMVQQCSNLERLSVHVVAPAEEGYTVPRDFLSPVIFSLPSLHDIEVSLVVTTTTKRGLAETDGVALNQLIQGLPRLEPLDDDMLQLISLRQLNELRFEPIAGGDDSTRKCSLGLALTTPTTIQQDTNIIQ